MRFAYELDNVLGAVYHRGSLKFGPDGSSIFSPVGNKVIVYDLKGSRSSALNFQINYNIDRLCIHPKGTIMLASSEKSHLYMISLTSGKVLHLKEYKCASQIDHISFSPDGKYYCICLDNLILIYITPGTLVIGKGREITPFRLVKKRRIGHESITDVSWSLNSAYVCVACQDMTLNVIPIHEQEHDAHKLGGHSDNIMACYFANRSETDLQIYSLTKNCQLFVWDTINKEENTGESTLNDKKRFKQKWKIGRLAKHYLNLPVDPDESKEEKQRRNTAYITSSDYNAKVALLVVGYNTGHYSLYEMPSANLIYDLDSLSGSLTSISLNHTGDWIALGSAVDPEVDVTNASNKTQSRLFVWEWQSKSHVLDQYGSGVSMLNMHECVSYSLDGTHIVSGNLAGRIKVWSGHTGDTIATFGEEHIAPIKAIRFAPNKSGKVILSASLDGTIRAYDLQKFKNFRTFQSPVPDLRPEFICLDIDSTGEFIAAGTYNFFEIYLYSLQTGKFLEHLTGHEGPVSGVAFSPISNLLVSSSWDKTIRVWNLFEGSKSMRDTISFNHEIITITFRPDGNQFAASLSNGQIVLFNPFTAEQLGVPIEGIDDLGTTHLVTEVSREDKKFFLTLNYSADGAHIIGGGNSNYICIYHTEEKILVKKIAITFNMSMDGIFDYVSSRKRKEFGYNLELLEQRLEERSRRPIQLPGVRKGDLGDRNAKPVIAVNQIVFSPTMRSFTAATTEGVLVFSLDISRNFDPYKLTTDVDPVSVHKAIVDHDFGVALYQSVQLSDKSLIQEVLEKIPFKDMGVIMGSMESDHILRILILIASILPITRHLEHYLLLIKMILFRHGMMLKSLRSRDITPVVRALHQSVYRSYMDVKKYGDFCKYSIEYLIKATRGDIIDKEANNVEEAAIVDRDLD